MGLTLLDGAAVEAERPFLLVSTPHLLLERRWKEELSASVEHLSPCQEQAHLCSLWFLLCEIRYPGISKYATSAGAIDSPQNTPVATPRLPRSPICLCHRQTEHPRRILSRGQWVAKRPLAAGAGRRGKPQPRAMPPPALGMSPSRKVLV